MIVILNVLKSISAQNATSTNTLNFLQELLAKYGTPNTMVPDNASQFMFEEFKISVRLMRWNIWQIHLTARGRMIKHNASSTPWKGHWKKPMRESWMRKVCDDFLSVWADTQFKHNDVGITRQVNDHKENKNYIFSNAAAGEQNKKLTTHQILDKVFFQKIPGRKTQMDGWYIFLTS